MVQTLFPVIVLAVIQSVIALLLLGPLPIAKAAIALCKTSKSSVGKTFMATLSAFLLILLIPPVLEVRSLRSQTRLQSLSGLEYSEASQVHRRDAETLAGINAVLTIYCLLINFVLQKLGLTLSNTELAKLKESTLLKQVKGLHAEYDRLSNQTQQNSVSEISSSATEKLTAELAKLEGARQSAEQNLLEANKRAEIAELNMDAMKTQTKGLENEYDRLLSLNEKLERRIAQLDPQFTVGAGNSKKSW